MPTLSVVVPTSGDAIRLDRVLLGLSRQTKQDFHVVVCDDGTDDAVGAICAEHSPHLDVFCARVNAGRGAGYARNRGVESSTAPRVLFLDGDCVPEPGVVAAHAVYDDQRVGVVGTRRMVAAEHHELLRGKLADVPWEPEVRARGNQGQRFRRLSDARAVAFYKYAFTCHVSYPLTMLLCAGGFDEAFRGAGYEDLELALRMTRLGVTLRGMLSPVVYHQNHPQSHHQTDNLEHNKALYLRTVRDPQRVTRPGQLKHMLQRDGSS